MRRLHLPGYACYRLFRVYFLLQSLVQAISLEDGIIITTSVVAKQEPIAIKIQEFEPDITL